MDSTQFLFDPPSKSARKKGPSSLRSLKAKSSRSNSKASNSSKDSLLSDILGIKSRNTPVELDDSPILKFSSSASIASGSTDSTSSSASSSASTATKASSVSSTEREIFGIKLRPSQEAPRPQTPNGVELAGQAYKVPEPIDKSFYKDLTFMEDEELIKKYGLILVGPSHKADEIEEEEKKKADEKTERDWLRHPPRMAVTKFV